MAGYSNFKGDNALFINPYNFVSVDFDSEPVRKDASVRKRGSSGVLHCELVTKTPLSIPDVAEADLSKDHKEFDFMRNSDEVPMIPGSSIRGPIRSVYEALTNSCMSTVDEDQLITYRTKKAFEPGLLYLDERGEYHLFEAKRYIFGVIGGTYARYDMEPDLYTVEVNRLDDYAYGDTVYISAVKGEKAFKTRKGFTTKSVFIEKMGKNKADGLMQGYICIGEPFARKKHFESVFVKEKEVAVPKNENGQSLLSKPVKGLSEIIKL